MSQIGGLSWTSAAWRAFESEAEDILAYDEKSTEEDDINRIRQAWIEIGDAGRGAWHLLALRASAPPADDASAALETRCILLLARFLRPQLNRIHYGEGQERWKGFGRWFLRRLDNAHTSAGPVCQAAVRGRFYDENGRMVWKVISPIFVAKLVEAEEVPVPEPVLELQIHDLMTVTAVAEECNYIIHLQGGGLDRLSSSFTVLTDRAKYGCLDEVINRHQQQEENIEVPEAFIWYLIHALSQTALIMERGGIAGPREGWNKEVVHLDIRSANIVLHRPNPSQFRRYPTPKLIDFGCALATDDADTQNPYGYGARGAHWCPSPEMYWSDWQDRSEYQNRNPLIATGNHKLNSKTNIYQIGLVARKLMTCSGNHAQDFSFEDYEEPPEGEELDWEPNRTVYSKPAPPDYTVDDDAEPEPEDDGKPDLVGPIDDGEAAYTDMQWREPHDAAIGSYSSELVKLVNHMLRFLPKGRPNAAAVYMFSRQHMKVWQKRQAYQPSREAHHLMYKDG